MILSQSCSTPKTTTSPEPVWPQGHFTFTQFQDTAHWKVWVDDTYQPDPGFMTIISESVHNYQIRCYAATWCGDSKEVVPQFFHLLELAGYDPALVDYILLNKDRKGWVQLAGADSIRRVPTFIILKDGKEAGRITERPVQTLEADLAAILTH
ncbi:MAG: thioredoxin family protein [Bacteroidetes bacterium]|nr:thioredoxin family protein [Bacteroidota bacterium]